MRIVWACMTPETPTYPPPSTPSSPLCSHVALASYPSCPLIFVLDHKHWLYMRIHIWVVKNLTCQPKLRHERPSVEQDRQAQTAKSHAHRAALARFGALGLRCNVAPAALATCPPLPTRAHVHKEGWQAFTDTRIPGVLVIILVGNAGLLVALGPDHILVRKRAPADPLERIEQAPPCQRSRPAAPRAAPPSARVSRPG